MTQKTNPWTYDVRVRERNLRTGAITEKDVDKYVAGLPDLADQAEPFGTAQPALAQPPSVDVDDDMDDDEDEGDVEGDGGGASEGAGEAPAPHFEPQGDPSGGETDGSVG